MKFLILALTAAVAFSAATVGTTSLSYTATYNTGTKLNATCSLATSFTGTYAGMTAGSEYHGLWLASTTTVTTASTADMMIFAAWTETSTGATAMSTTFATAPAATAYSSSGTAWVSNASITTNTTSITAGATGVYTTAMTFVLPLALVNGTSSNFTKSSLSWNYWIVLSESAALTYNSASWTGTATGTTTISLSACTTGMAAISSSSYVASIISSFLALSFF